MTKVVYDIEGEDKIERQITLVEDAQEGVAQGLVPGKFLVQFLPFLRHVPAWLPGAGFKCLSNKWRAAAWSAKYVPFREVKQALVSLVRCLNDVAKVNQLCRQNEKGDKRRGVVGQLLAKLAHSGLTEEARAEEEDVISNVASVAFQGAYRAAIPVSIGTNDLLPGSRSRDGEHHEPLPSAIDNSQSYALPWHRRSRHLWVPSLRSLFTPRCLEERRRSSMPSSVLTACPTSATATRSFTLTR